MPTPSQISHIFALHEIFSLPDDIEKKILMLEFEKADLEVARVVAYENTRCSATRFWKHLQGRLLNSIHVQTRNTAFSNNRFNKSNDTVAKDGERVQSLIHSLG